MSSKYWHKRDPQSYADLRDRIEVEFPELLFQERGGRVVVSGIYPISDSQGRAIDLYRIEIIFPPDGPRSGIPVVRETGGRIPWISDRHIEKNGNACLCVPDEFWYENPDGMDLVDFLRGLVKSFFTGQSLVEAGKSWPQGERSHGAAGIVEFYSGIVGTADPERIMAYLEVLAAPKLRGHWDCPCGNGGRIRNCHLPMLTELRKHVRPGTALDSLEKVRKAGGKG